MNQEQMNRAIAGAQQIFAKMGPEKPGQVCNNGKPIDPRDAQVFGYSMSSNTMLNENMQQMSQATSEQKLNDAYMESQNKLEMMRQQLNEAKQQQMLQQQYPTQYQQPMQYGGGIDYNAIQNMINEAVSKQLGGKVNETTDGNMLKGLKICKGNKIQFIDSKGNVFEAILTLKKKAAE